MENNSESFIIASRNKGIVSTTFSLVASSIGGSATIGVVALSWEIGFPSIWYLLSGAIGLLIMGLTIASKVRETNAKTLAEFVGHYIDRRTKILVSIIIVVAWISILAAQFSAVSNILSSFFNVDLTTLKFIVSLIIIFYTMIGGQSMVIESDKWQLIVIVIALIAVLFSITSNNPISLADIKFELLNDKFKFPRLSYYLLILGGSYVVCPMLFGRLLSTKSAKVAKVSVLLAVPFIILISLLVVLIGIYSKAVLDSSVNPEEVLTSSLMLYLNPIVSKLLLIGLLAAIVSSADSCLITASTIFGNDILNSSKIKTYRVTTLLIGLLAYFLSSYGGSILSYLFAANDIYVSGIVFPVFLLLIFKDRYQIKNQLFFLSILSGGVFGLVSALSDGNMFSYIGILSSIILASFSIGKAKREII